MSVRTARFLIAISVALLAPAMVQAQATPPWITFTEMTGTYLSIPGVSTDPEEKDFLLADLDKDGDLDLVNARKQAFYATGSRTHLLIMNVGGVMTDQTATFAPGFNSNPSLARVVIIADFDNDTWDDVVIVNTDSQAPHYYKNLGSSGGNWLGLQFETGHFPTFSPGGRFCSAAAGDINGDGDKDLFLGDYNNTLDNRMLGNNGAGIFTDITATSLPGSVNDSTFSVEANFADADNDGDLDLYESDGTVGLMKVHVNNGSGVYSTQIISSGQATYTNAIGDLNNDNKIDIYQGRDGQDAYSINTSAGASISFTTTVLTTANAPKTTDFAGNAYLVDMDNDGDRDLVMADTDVDVPGCNRNAVLYRNGHIGPAQTQLLMDPFGATLINVNTQGTHDIAVLDLNGDGAMDMIYGLCTGYKVFIQDGVPFSLQVTEPFPTALSISINNGAANTTTYTLFTPIVALPAGSGAFFGLDPSAFTVFLDLHLIGPPIVATTDGSGDYSFLLPAGMPSPFPTQWRSLQLDATDPTGVKMSNIVTYTF